MPLDSGAPGVLLLRGGQIVLQYRAVTVADTGSTASIVSGTPPGWYDDKVTHRALRWWDGRAWTEHTHALSLGQKVTPPGWYDDQRTPGMLRWWDGLAWSEQTRAKTPPADAPAVVPTAASVTAAVSVGRHSRAAHEGPAGSEEALGAAGGEYVGLLGARWQLTPDAGRVRWSV